MSLVTRPRFERGWMPDADPVGCPDDALPRMDNCVLDELGVVALRRGADVLSTPAAEDVHSLYTAVLDGVRLRFSAAVNTVYSNAVAIASGFTGTDDVSFGGMLGQIFFGRSTTKKKYDGTTVRNWGIAMTGGVPTTASGTSDSKEVGSGDSTESPAFVIEYDDGTGAVFIPDHNAVVNGALAVRPDAAGASLGAAQAVKTYASPTDFTTYDGGALATDDDIFSMWFYITEPSLWKKVTIYFDFTADFQDIAQATWYNPSYPAAGNGSSSYTPVAGWNLLSRRRGDFFRPNPIFGSGWETVNTFRFVSESTAGGLANRIAVDDMKLSGGESATSGAISGSGLSYKYVYARNVGSYTALSAPSSASALFAASATSIAITVPADPSRDTQVNEVWLYRSGEELGDDFYRVVQKTSVSGTGTVSITDTMTGTDALTVNIKLDDTIAPPPDTMIGMAGPHFDRLWVLTSSTLYPSKQRNPESFGSGEAITVGGSTEVAYWVAKAPGGLYVGTSGDIYRIDGDGNPLPDGTINVQKIPLGIDHPPVSAAFAVEGAALVYLASDGWRGLDGYSSTHLVGATSLLYKGHTRHGVGPVNVETGRFRVALSKGQLVAITPEGSDTASSSVLYRYVFALKQWYRHTYDAAWRSLTREPDGTLLAGDTDGNVWTLDTETDGDDGEPIDVEVWTKVDDLGDPFRTKMPSDLHLQVDTGGDTLTVAVHQDGSDTSALTDSVSTSALEGDVVSLSDLSASRHLSARLTGAMTTFRLGAVGWSVVPQPLGVLTYDSGPLDAGSAEFMWLRAIRLQVLGASDLTVTLYANGIAMPAVSVTPESTTHAVPVTAWFGRGYKGKVFRVLVTSATPFVPYWMDVIHRVSGSLVTDKRIIRTKAAA